MLKGFPQGEKIATRNMKITRENISMVKQVYNKGSRSITYKASKKVKRQK